MIDWKDILITPEMTILDTMKIIDKSSLQFAVVVDCHRHLLGTVTDGDIRRGILKGLPLDTTIQKVMNKKPTFEKKGKSHSYYTELLKTKHLKQLPILDEDNQVYDILFADNLNQRLGKDNSVILMAGGMGTRLRPLTDEIPKPMLKVGDKPILETIIEGFKSFGFTKFIISVNYRKEIIENYFQNGSQFGVDIQYVEESKRMGTAGALSLLPEKPEQPFFVMNADLLTKINYEQLMNFHKETKSVATLCVREYEYQIPYGVIKTSNDRLLSIVEKPIHKSFVNAGIYVLDPDILQYVPQNEFFDMPDLFKRAVNYEREVSAFPLREYWLDIGQVADYDKANGDYRGVFI
ncbi:MULTISPECIES: nucleotidyltransferase family protein [Paenibacillus]|uniref:CBS domain protein n=1 Tax=Paenibacillus pabuli TaxID=1472 RepID=A0A855Y3W2_9BACL|nr:MULTISPECIES: nucleotidyltransferase family protein [Paenibacillus]PWW37449.1 CBS domain protein [Paenibacillus pabuli]PXW05591.1 CBS domain protein [Paenibacillus taichungensis]RAI98873.1 CBS domain protein [Paenibacillus pabuli]